MSLGSLSGPLKQQVDEGDGNYEWRRRNFSLDLDSGKLSAKEDGKVVSLEAALYAKAWSISSPAVGYGFDIVWSDGNMMSFIASEEADCSAWVNGINSSIKFNSDGGGSGLEGKEVDILDVILDNTLPQVPPAQPVRSRGQQGQPATRPPLPVATSGVRRGRSVDDSPDRQNSRGSSPISEIFDTHLHRKMARGEGVLNASSIATVGSDHSHFNSPASNNRSGVGGLGEGDKGKSVMSDNGDDGLPSSGKSTREDDLEMENFRLQQKCMRLHSKAEREAMDAQIAREQLEKVQTELDYRNAQHGRDLASAEEKEKLAVSQAKAEVDMRVLKASNESAAFHEEAMRAEREQATRELQCLKEDLDAERKRFAALLKEESTARKRAEDHEVGLQQEITSLKEQTQRQQTEISKLQKQQRSDQSHWQREREMLRQESEALSAKVEKEREDQASKAQLTLRAKLSELQMKFESKIKEAESNITETARQEHEGLRLRDMTVLEKRYEKEIEQVRTEERKARAREVDSLKGIFRSNERQTAEDLAQLEKLHGDRVKRLEVQVETLKAKVSAAEKVASEASELANRGSDEVRKQAAEHVKQAKAAMRKAEELAEHLARAHKDLQEARVREGTYRDQLSKNLEESRVQRAELLEAKKQATDSAAECFHYRKMVQEQGTEKSESVLQITRNEISFLENEVQRLRDDNHALVLNVQKHEKLIYGQPTEVAARGTLRRALTPGRTRPSTPTRSLSPAGTPSRTMTAPSPVRHPPPTVPSHRMSSATKRSLTHTGVEAYSVLESSREPASHEASESFAHNMSVLRPSAKKTGSKDRKVRKGKLTGTFGTSRTGRI